MSRLIVELLFELLKRALKVSIVTIGIGAVGLGSVGCASVPPAPQTPTEPRECYTKAELLKAFEETNEFIESYMKSHPVAGEKESE